MGEYIHGPWPLRKQRQIHVQVYSDFLVGDLEKGYVLVGMSYLFVTNSLLGLQNSLLANFKRKNFACKWAVQAEAPGPSRHTSGG